MIESRVRRDVLWLRQVADVYEADAAWLDLAAARPDCLDGGPIPAHLASAVPVHILRQWANNNRAKALRLRTEANQLITREATR